MACPNAVVSIRGRTADAAQQLPPRCARRRRPDHWRHRQSYIVRYARRMVAAAHGPIRAGFPPNNKPGCTLASASSAWRSTQRPPPGIRRSCSSRTRSDVPAQAQEAGCRRRADAATARGMRTQPGPGRSGAGAVDGDAQAQAGRSRPCTGARGVDVERKIRPAGLPVARRMQGDTPGSRTPRSGRARAPVGAPRSPDIPFSNAVPPARPRRPRGEPYQPLCGRCRTGDRTPYPRRRLSASARRRSALRRSAGQGSR